MKMALMLKIKIGLQDLSKKALLALGENHQRLEANAASDENTRMNSAPSSFSCCSTCT